MKIAQNILIAVVLIVLATVLYVSAISNREVTVVDEDTLTEENVLQAVSIENLPTEETEDYEVTLALPHTESLYGKEAREFFVRYADDFKRDAEKAMPELRRGGGVPFKYTLDVVTDVFVSEGMLSYVIYSGEYTGGANANHVAFSFVYDIETGARRTLFDIVRPSDRDAFMKTVKEKLYTQNGVTAGGEGIFVEVIDSLVFDDLRTFYSDNGHITILFSKYEVAPGAAGIVTVMIP